jgi:hypothetical protein
MNYRLNRRAFLTVVVGLITAYGLTPAVLSADAGASPSIKSISPNIGPVGTQITIMGSGFAAPEFKIYLDSTDYFLMLEQRPSDDNKFIFTLPRSLHPTPDPHTLELIKKGRINVHWALKNLTSGTHQFSIQTANGTSNSVAFTVSVFPGKVSLDQSSLTLATGFPVISGTAENVDALFMTLAAVDGRPGIYAGPLPIPVYKGHWSIDLHQPSAAFPQLCPLEPGRYFMQMSDAKTHVYLDLPESHITIVQPK